MTASSGIFKGCGVEKAEHELGGVKHASAELLARIEFHPAWDRIIPCSSMRLAAIQNCRSWPDSILAELIKSDDVPKTTSVETAVAAATSIKEKPA